MLVILVMGITTVFVTSLSGTALQNRRNHSSAEALARAKEALVGYAVTYGDTNPAKSHGFLPCPDSDGSAGANTEGSSESCGSTDVDVLGRLPWRTLDLPPLFDGAGECLWYAVSGKYKNTQSSSTINWDTLGHLQDYDSNGNPISSSDEIVAAVIAPGAPLSSNSDRAGSSAPTCGGNYTAAAYLDNDTVHGINNSNILQGKFILPHEDSSTVSTNDQIVFITRQDIWNGVQKRIARQAKKCLDDYAAGVLVQNTDHKYPWAVQLSDATASPTRTGTQNVRFGRFPDVPNISTAGGSGACSSTSSPLSHLTAAQISTLNDYIQQVQDALDTYVSDPTPTNKSNLENKGDNLWDLAKDPPYSLIIGDSIRYAGWYVDNNCDSGDACNTSTIQTYLNAAFTEITDCTGSGGSTDSTMSASWSSIPSCQFISSPSWSAWRDWVFIQIADGYQPGGAGSCTTGSTCLTVTGSGHTNGGSGSYHAVVGIAAKLMSGQNRSTIDSVSDFLEGANATGKAAIPTTTSYETYRISDASYNAVNDTVLCIDGKNNCP